MFTFMNTNKEEITEIEKDADMKYEINEEINEEIQPKYSFKELINMNPDDVEGDITNLISVDDMAEKMNKVEFRKFFTKFYEYFSQYEINEMLDYKCLSDIVENEIARIKINNLFKSPRNYILNIIKKEELDKLDEDEIKFFDYMSAEETSKLYEILFEEITFNEYISFLEILETENDGVVDNLEKYSKSTINKLREKFLEEISKGNFNNINFKNIFSIYILHTISNEKFTEIIKQCKEYLTPFEVEYLLEFLQNSKLDIFIQIYTEKEIENIMLYQKFIENISSVNILNLIYKNYTGDFNFYENDENILHMIYKSNFDILKYYIDKGVSLNHLNNDGVTPFMLMCKVHNRETIKKLLEYKPYLHYFDKSNKMILDYVESNPNDIVDLIISEIDFFTEYKNGLQVFTVHHKWLRPVHLQQILTKTIIDIDQLNRLIEIYMDAKHIHVGYKDAIYAYSQSHTDYLINSVKIKKLEVLNEFKSLLERK